MYLHEFVDNTMRELGGRVEPGKEIQFEIKTEKRDGADGYIRFNCKQIYYETPENTKRLGDFDTGKYDSTGKMIVEEKPIKKKWYQKIGNDELVFIAVSPFVIWLFYHVAWLGYHLLRDFYSRW